MEPNHPLPVLGLDTGFFRRLLERAPRALRAWADVQAGRAVAAVSCITLFELDRLGLRGALPREAADTLVRTMDATCRVVWFGAADGPGLLHRAARLAHGSGLAMADALILASLLDAGAGTVFTTDRDFDRYEGPAEVVVL